MLEKYIKFITRDVWQIRLKSIPSKKSFFLKQLRVIILTIKGFLDDKCTLRASALTFYTLLSIVPIMAMLFGIAKGFHMEKMLKKQLVENISSQEGVIHQMIKFAENALEKTQGGMVAGIGIALLLWTVIKGLGNIEHAFNDIWGVKEHRKLTSKILYYISIVAIGFLLFVLASGVTGFVASRLEDMAAEYQYIQILMPLIKFFPWVVMWILFTFIYLVMPNTKVTFTSALIAGICAGSLYQLLQIFFIIFQVGVSKYNAIYGSFAALPLFLIWLQLSWYIVLLGAEIAFAHQNVENYEFGFTKSKVSHSFKRLLSLNVMTLIVQQFNNEKHPMNDEEIGNKLEMPIRLVREILFDLSEAGLIAEVVVKDEINDAYQPAISINNLTIQRVIDSLDEHGQKDIPVASSKELDKISETIEVLHSTFSSNEANILLKNI